MQLCKDCAHHVSNAEFAHRVPMPISHRCNAPRFADERNPVTGQLPDCVVIRNLNKPFSTCAGFMPAPPAVRKRPRRSWWWRVLHPGVDGGWS
jgi:hypothetical protein